MSNTHVLLLTGRPGVGKTTAVRKVAERLTDYQLGGFYTEEVRSYGKRQGFRLVTLEGQEAVIAHVDFSHTQRISKYGVDIAKIDAMVEKTLDLNQDGDIYLVDEIGKMECLSQRFIAAVKMLLDSKKPLVATIAQKGGGFMAEIKQRKDAQLWELTRDNRDEIPEKAVAWLEKVK